MNFGKATVIYVCLIAMTLVFTAQSKAEIDPAAVIAVWSFDEGDGDTAGDASPNHVNGSIAGEPNWVEGMFGQALEFNTEEDYVEIPPSPLFNPETFTFTFWIYPYTIGGNNPAGRGTSTLVIANGNPGDGGGANWWLEHWNGGNFEFKSCQAGCVGALVPINTANKWYFLAGIYNGTEYELYLDGEFKTKGANVVGAPEKGLLISNGLCAAGDGCDGGYYNGIIDDVAMFNGILTQDDIVKLMDQGAMKTLGLSIAVSPAGRLTTTWAQVKKGLL